MKKISWLLSFLFTGMTVNAAIYTWDNESGDDQWTTPLNWTNNSTLPKQGDTVIFAPVVGPCQIATNAHVAYLLSTNSTGTLLLDIPGGYSLKASLWQGVNINSTNAIVISGGGLFAPTGEVYVTYKTSAGGAAVAQGDMTVSNITLETANLSTLTVGYNNHNGGAVSGRLDLSSATVQWNAQTNMLATKGSLEIGGNMSVGTLLLPPSLTNLTVMGVEFALGGMRPEASARQSVLDLGENPQLKTLSVSNTFRYIHAKCLYTESGVSKTGFPSGLTLEIGAPGQPGNLQMGYSYSLSHRTILKNILALRAYLSSLYVGRTDNNAGGLSYTELDLSEGSVSNLEGSITRSSMSIPVLLVGAGYQGTPTGVLKLPATMTNLSFNTLEVGSQYVLNFPSNSLIHLGTNSIPVVLTVSNVLILGHAEFVTVNPAGVSSNTLPAGSKLRVGTPEARAMVQLGCISYLGSSAYFGMGFDDVRLYASNVVVGKGGWGNHHHYYTTDFRSATNVVWDVQDQFLIGTNLGDHMQVWFPGGSRLACSNFSIGQADPSAYNYRACLLLSNSAFAVNYAATIKETGVITNFIDGTSSGLDIGTTNLDLQDPNVSSSNSFRDYGRMDLRFTRDPVNAYRPYWGLRLKGDARGLIQELVTTNSTYVYPRLTWVTNGLSAASQSRFGVQYDGQQTYIGVRPLVRGSLILVK